jgi:hypothetical protein
MNPTTINAPIAIIIATTAVPQRADNISPSFIA